jgi:energy-coupling factor transporter ATP-binding protein EcfA2
LKLQSLSIGSLKGFDKLQKVDLSDVTLLYGANSSGKSSVFQALLLLQQSTQRGFGPNSHTLQFRGQNVDLGGFRTFVHRHDLTRNVTVGLDVSDANDANSWALFDSDLDIRLSFGLMSEEAGDTRVVEVVLRDSRGQVRFVHDDELDSLKLADATSSASVVERYASRLDLIDVRSRPVKELSEADRRWLREWSRKHGCSTLGWMPVWQPHEYGPGKVGRPFGGSVDSTRFRLLQDFIFVWYDGMLDLTVALTRMLNAIVYVGPLRDFPRRVAVESSFATGVGVRGERLVLHLGRRPDLVAKVNECFRALDIDYDLSIEQLKAEKVEDALGDVAVAVLRDLRTGVSVSPADVGFGLSQVLPIVVQLAGSVDSLILVEQPEIHLHPRVQSRLADLIIDSAVSNRNRILIETHSEHILSRLQRRIRERMHPGFGGGSVSVNYISTSDRGSVAEVLRLDERGKLLDPWPDGFFDERLDDLFSGF